MGENCLLSLIKEITAAHEFNIYYTYPSGTAISKDPPLTPSHVIVDIDECISIPCFNNGTCNDAVNGYSCSCIPGFTGTYCEISKLWMKTILNGYFNAKLWVAINEIVQWNTCICIIINRKLPPYTIWQVVVLEIHSNDIFHKYIVYIVFTA
jgi:Notch-like protein